MQVKSLLVTFQINSSLTEWIEKGKKNVYLKKIFIRNIDDVHIQLTRNFIKLLAATALSTTYFTIFFQHNIPGQNSVHTKNSYAVVLKMSIFVKKC